MRKRAITKKNIVESPGSEPGKTTVVTAEERRQLIATTAYLRAKQRGFAPGSEMEDWLAAEAEIDKMLGKSGEARGSAAKDN